MKRLLIIFFLIFWLVLFSPQVSFSQEKVFDFNQAYQDYLYTHSRYQTAHTEYVSAKSAYSTYQTLTAKTEALTKTIAMLQLRDEVIRTYLTALRLKLAETTGISDYEQTILYLKLDDEVNWYLNHRQTISSVNSLTDASQSSLEAATRHPQTEVLIYQTLGTIFAGKERALREEIRNQVTEINNKVAEIRQKGDKDTAILERWLLETENKLVRSQEKEFEAQQLLAQLEADKEKQSQYNQARSLFRESHQYLKEAHSHLKEIIREVKRAT